MFLLTIAAIIIASLIVFIALATYSLNQAYRYAYVSTKMKTVSLSFVVISILTIAGIIATLLNIN